MFGKNKDGGMACLILCVYDGSSHCEMMFGSLFAPMWDICMFRLPAVYVRDQRRWCMMVFIKLYASLFNSSINQDSYINI